MEYVRAEVDRREVGGRRGTGREAPPEAGEIGTSLAVENGDDAVEDHTMATPDGRGRGDVRKTAGEVARHLSLDADGSARIHEEQCPGAVPVDTEQPIAIVEGFCARDRRLDGDVPGQLGRRWGPEGQGVGERREGGT